MISETDPQPCSALTISETILKTGQLDAMKRWYTTILGVGPFFEHAPAAGATPGDYDGPTRASDRRMCFFRLSLDYPYVNRSVCSRNPAPGQRPGARRGSTICS